MAVSRSILKTEIKKVGLYYAIFNLVLFAEQGGGSLPVQISRPSHVKFEEFENLIKDSFAKCTGEDKNKILNLYYTNTINLYGRYGAFSFATIADFEEYSKSDLCQKTTIKYLSEDRLTALRLDMLGAHLRCCEESRKRLIHYILSGEALYKVMLYDNLRDQSLYSALNAVRNPLRLYRDLLMTYLPKHIYSKYTATNSPVPVNEFNCGTIPADNSDAELTILKFINNMLYPILWYADSDNKAIGNKQILNKYLESEYISDNLKLRLHTLYNIAHARKGLQTNTITFKGIEDDVEYTYVIKDSLVTDYATYTSIHALNVSECFTEKGLQLIEEQGGSLAPTPIKDFKMEEFCE